MSLINHLVQNPIYPHKRLKKPANINIWEAQTGEFFDIFA